VKSGKATGFAVSTARRSTLAPELPTMAEAGVKGYDLAAWFAAFVPAKTPKPVIDGASGRAHHRGISVCQGESLSHAERQSPI
jgi:tripartite-type tricarboxylate transporter receptor subunit TctC